MLDTGCIHPPGLWVRVTGRRVELTGALKKRITRWILKLFAGFPFGPCACVMFSLCECLDLFFREAKLRLNSGLKGIYHMSALPSELQPIGKKSVRSDSPGIHSRLWKAGF